MGFDPHLWLHDVVGGFIKLTTSYVLIDEEKQRFIQIIENLKAPTHYVPSLTCRELRMGISR